MRRLLSARRLVRAPMPRASRVPRSALLLAATLACAEAAPAPVLAPARAPAPPATCPPAAGARPAVDCTIAALRGDSSGWVPDDDALYAAANGLAERALLESRPGDVEAMQSIVAALDARHATRPAERRKLMHVLLLSGRVEEARTVQAQIPSERAEIYPLRVHLAAPRRATEARYFTFDAQGGVLRERTLDLAHGAHILVQADEGCHFCRDALRRIPDDPMLGAAFRAHAVWYARADAAAPVAVLARWDARYPGVPLAIVDDMAGWPAADGWGTPVFHFVRDGRVVKTVNGWIPGKTENELSAGLQAIGLAP